MQTPQLVMVKETSPGWVRISWNNDNVAPNVTGFMILIADMNCISAITCREELQVARNESEKKVQLVMERTYQIKMVTLSRQLPSDPSAPIYHTVQKGMVLLSTAMKQSTTLNLCTLACPGDCIYNMAQATCMLISFPCIHERICHYNYIVLLVTRYFHYAV